MHILAEKRGQSAFIDSPFKDVADSLLRHIMRFCALGTIRALAQTCRVWRSVGWILMRDEVLANDGKFILLAYGNEYEPDSIGLAALYRQSILHWKTVRRLSAKDDSIVNELSVVRCRQKHEQEQLFRRYSDTNRPHSLSSPLVYFDSPLVYSLTNPSPLGYNQYYKDTGINAWYYKTETELEHFFRKPKIVTALKVDANGTVAFTVLATAKWREVVNDKNNDSSSPHYKRLLSYVMYKA